MEITEVRIKLMNCSQDRLLGFCSITFDQAFVIRDLKIIKGEKGAFVAMPSRKLTDRCPGCGFKNALRSAYCSQCGHHLRENRSPKLPDGRARLYADIAHPIKCECRDMIQSRVLFAYDEELILAQQPGYVCRYDDFGEEDLNSIEHDRWEDHNGDEHGRMIPVISNQEDWHPEDPLNEPHESDEAAVASHGRDGEFGAGIF